MKSTIWILLFCILQIVVGWYISEKGYYKGSIWNSQFEGWFGIFWGLAIILFVISAIVRKITENKRFRRGSYELYEYLKKERIPLSSIILYSEQNEILAFDLSDKIIAIIKIDTDGDYYHYLFDANDVIKSEITLNNKVVSSVCCNGFIDNTEAIHEDGIILKYILKRKLFKELTLCLHIQTKDLERIEMKLLSKLGYLVKPKKTIKLVIDSANRWQNTIAEL